AGGVPPPALHRGHRLPAVPHPFRQLPLGKPGLAAAPPQLVPERPGGVDHPTARRGPGVHVPTSRKVRSATCRILAAGAYAKRPPGGVYGSGGVDQAGWGTLAASPASALATRSGRSSGRSWPPVTQRTDR